VGVVSGDILVTVVAPDLTTTEIPTASETPGKPGLYTFLVSSGFLVSNGVGVYGVVIEIDSSAPKVLDVFSAPIRITVRDIDDVYNLGQGILGNVV
jgi:hypothetical protein